MNTEIQSKQHSLYETDFVNWIETTVTQLRQRAFANVDWENLIEEIEDMARRQRDALESNLIVLFLHLLKWQYQPEQRSGSWKGSITEHRRRIRKALKNSPSLRSYLETVFEECYFDAIEQASAETGLPQNTFPETCPYSVPEILDINFPVD
jgi:hypothetical protein